MDYMGNAQIEGTWIWMGLPLLSKFKRLKVLICWTRFKIAVGAKDISIVMQVKRTRAFGEKSLSKILIKTSKCSNALQWYQTKSNQNVQMRSWVRRHWVLGRWAREGENTGRLQWPNQGSGSSGGTGWTNLARIECDIDGIHVHQNFWYRRYISVVIRMTVRWCLAFLLWVKVSASSTFIHFRPGLSFFRLKIKKENSWKRTNLRFNQPVANKSWKVASSNIQ